MKRILITGGAGFVGSNLAISFKQEFPSHEIICFDNLKRRGSELNISRLLDNGIEFIHGDVRCKEDFHEIKEVDFIIDASAEPSVLAGIYSPIEQVYNNNLTGTVNCLELAKRFNAAFIFLSTSRIYPIKTLESLNFIEKETRFELSKQQSIPGVSERGVAEEFPLNGSRSFYGTTKLASELMITEYSALAGVKAVINRCGVITGPWQMGKVDQGVVVLWMARHFWKQKLSYIGYGGFGKQTRDILHVNDLFALIKWQLENIDRINGETFNVGGGLDGTVSLLELTQFCQEITGNKIEIERVAETRPADIKFYCTDNTKVFSTTGWTPQTKPLEIMKGVYQWIKANESSLTKILK